MVRTFYRQDVHLLLTFIETKILFSKIHNFIIWSRIHSKLSFDNYNKLLPSGRAEALYVVWKSVIELWLHTICLPGAIIKSLHCLRSSGSQPRWLPYENETSRHTINPQKNSQELFKNKPPQGAPFTFLLTVSMSVTCTPTSKQTQKMFHFTLHASYLLQGLAYSESQAEEVTKSFEGHNQVL